jgi:hypothetical protein
VSSPPTPDVLTEFRTLGDRVREAWRACAFDVDRFAAVAVAALQTDPPCARLGWAEVAHGFLRSRDPPPQRDLRFGQPQLTVYRHERFYIEVLFWIDGAPEIHRHNFHGAFQVLAGSSLHVRHGFTAERQISRALLLGELHLESAELLRPGDTRAIDGADLIHSLFHLDRPSATVVVRTPTGFAAPQYAYLPPHVAYDPFLRDSAQDKQLELLALLRAVAPDAHAAALAEFAAREDLHALLRALLAAPDELAETGALAPVLAAARAVHGDAVDRIAASLDHRRWTMDLVLRRRRISAPDHRFLLGLLAGLPDAPRILELVERRAGGDPCATIMTWIRELAREAPDGSLELLGVEVTHARTAHAELLGARLAPAFIAVLEAMLRRRSEPELVEVVRAFGPALTHAQARRVLHSWSPLRRSGFRPLFR